LNGRPRTAEFQSCNVFSVMPNEPQKDLVFEGAAGWYRKVDLETWGEASVLVPFDSDLKSLRFAFLGDLLCSALAHGILRAYVHLEEHTRALLLVGVKNGGLNVFGVFFDSKFADGATATTSTSPAVRNVPTEGIHRRVCAWTGIYDLHHEHDTHLNELKPLHGEPEPMGNTLLSVAKSLDSFSVRMNR
jgi:hypothetical protein